MISTERVDRDCKLPFSSGITLQPLADGRIQISDWLGVFICIVDEWSEVQQFFEAERNPFPDRVKRGHLRLGAREVAYPGLAASQEARILERRAAQQAEHERKSFLAGGISDLDPAAALAALGLT